jgi:hypothetical protein
VSAGARVAGEWAVGGAAREWCSLVDRVVCVDVEAVDGIDTTTELATDLAEDAGLVREVQLTDREDLALRVELGARRAVDVTASRNWFSMPAMSNELR